MENVCFALGKTTPLSAVWVGLGIGKSRMLRRIPPYSNLGLSLRRKEKLFTLRPLKQITLCRSNRTCVIVRNRQDGTSNFPVHNAFRRRDGPPSGGTVARLLFLSSYEGDGGKASAWRFGSATN